MGLVIIGIILIIVGGVLVWFKKSEEEKVGVIAGTETSTAQSLKEQQKAIASEIGGGSFRERVELKGKIECDSPLTADMTKQQCVYFKNEVIREYEEEYTETDDKGNRHRRTRKGSDTVSSLEQSTPFHLVDATGKIRIEPEGAEIDLIQVKDAFQPASAVNMGGGSISWGGFRFSVGSNWSMGEGRRTLGYRFREHVFPLNRNVYLLGEVADEGSELVVRKPVKEGRFFISYKSEEEILAEAAKNIKLYYYGSMACFAIGAVMAVAGLLFGK